MPLRGGLAAATRSFGAFRARRRATPSHRRGGNGARGGRRDAKSQPGRGGNGAR